MNRDNIRMAVILTCYNRKDKTLNCLKSLYEYSKKYTERDIEISVFLTDDGSSDGTSSAVKQALINENITILQGTGNLFWAGGMRLAWNYAISLRENYDYYLLVNDDVEILPNCFDELLSAVRFGEEHYGFKPIVSGIMKNSINHDEETYGGKVWLNKFLGTAKHLKPTGEPQKCDMAHANILLVPSYVVDEIGIFCKDYIHGGADHDYTLLANKKGIPVVVTGHYCGICENDHRKKTERPAYVASLPYKERIAYFDNPRHSIHDHIVYVRRNTPWRLPIVYIGYLLVLYVPQVYLVLNKLRHF